MQVTEWVPIHKLNRLQQLLKIHNGYFVTQYIVNSCKILDRPYMSYKFEDMESYKAFYSDWTRETTKIVEKTRKKTWLRTLKAFLYRLF
jgi:hypothetical protein